METVSVWEGYKKIEFDVNGRQSFIVCPEVLSDGNKWVWRTEFFGAFDSADRALLKKGWFLAYHRVSDMYGCPDSIKMMKEFYDVAVNTYALNKKPALFGFSRGGLYAVNFAAAYPDKTGLLYLDAPVLDIRSWPGGKGRGRGEKNCWEDCLRIYGLTEETAACFEDIPLNKAEKNAVDGIPVIIVYGDADEDVPCNENALLYYERYKKLSDKIEMIGKPGCAHHPHSLIQAEPITDFIEKQIRRE